jgi:hypothetical protein
MFFGSLQQKWLEQKEAKRQDKTRQDKMQTFNVTDHRTPD